MASVNQTWPHCIYQVGKTHSKPLAERHSRGMAWTRHVICESAFIVSPVGCLAIPYFCTSSHKRYSFQKKVTKHKMCVLIFSTTFVLNTSYSKKNSTRYYHKCKVPIILNRIERNLNFLKQIYEKYSTIKFHENPSSGRPAVPHGWTDRQM
jgi:hypothetical protein